MPASGAGASMHIIEVRRDGVAGPMAEMRNWLDARRIAPRLFTMSFKDKAVVFRLEFDSPDEAAAFAAAFGGDPADPAEPRAA